MHVMLLFTTLLAVSPSFAVRGKAEDGGHAATSAEEAYDVVEFEQAADVHIREWLQTEPSVDRMSALELDASVSRLVGLVVREHLVALDRFDLSSRCKMF